MSRMLSESNGALPSFKAGLKDDIKTKVMMTVPVAQIETYDKNPRRDTNPNYLKIKESIQCDGMNQPLVITRRPENSNFMIYKGGNTRLVAVQTLYDETGDTRFESVDCVFSPWTGCESDAIVGHLQENEMRKSLCFVDRACGVKFAIEQLKKELDQDNLSLRDIVTLLSSKGYPTSLSSLSVMIYAVDVIEESMPYALCKTFGRPQIQRIRTLDGASRKVCAEFKIREQEHHDIFMQTLALFDEVTWNFAGFRRELESQIAHLTETSIHDISLRIDGYMNLDDTPLNSDSVPVAIEPNHSDWKDSCTNFVQESGVYSVNTQTKTDILHNFCANTSFSSLSPSDSSTLSQSSKASAIQSRKQPSHKTIRTPNDQIATKLQMLRKRCASCAMSIARRFAFHEHPQTKRKVVSDIAYWGLGYLIIDFPAEAKQARQHDVALRDCLWWILFEFCDLPWALEADRPTTAKMAGGGSLLDYVRTADDSVLYRSARNHLICPRPLMSLFSVCSRRVDPQTWDDLTVLIDTYRSIHHLSVEHNIELFQQNPLEVNTKL